VKGDGAIVVVPGGESRLFRSEVKRGPTARRKTCIFGEGGIEGISTDVALLAVNNFCPV
jgi:hypothetical protein